MSPGWPDNYEDQLRCVYKFIGRPDQRVSVKFLHFDVKGIPPRSVTFVQKSSILVLLLCSLDEQRQSAREKKTFSCSFMYRNCFSQHFIVYSVELCPEKFLIIITVEIAISSSM